MPWECQNWDNHHCVAYFESRTGFPSVARGFAIVDTIKISNASYISYESILHIFVSPEEDDFKTLSFFEHIGWADKERVPIKWPKE